MTGAAVYSFGDGFDAAPEASAESHHADAAAPVDNPYAPPPGVGESPSRLLPPATAPDPPGKYVLSGTQLESAEPVTWSPCRPVKYVARPDNNPPGGDAALVGAIAVVSETTGLKFVDGGTTTEAPSASREPYQPKRYGDQWAPVLIAWATPEEVPDFGVDIAGEAGAVWVHRPDGTRVYVTGAVYLDPAAARDIRRQFGLKEVQALIQHELGHLVGLGHVNDATQIMYPRATGDVFRFGVGDRTGLALLGDGSCAPDI